MRVDGVVLDVDGVLVDVAGSYRRAIVETIRRLYGETVPRDAVQLFKDAGGFNNDWKVTDAIALFVLAHRAGYDASLEEYTRSIRERGGGLEAAEAVVAATVSREDAVWAEWDPDRIRVVFQELYLGRQLFAELEDGEPQLDVPGYIHDEPVLIEPETIRALTETYHVGVFTGRPAAEAALALGRAGLTIPEAHLLTMDDPIPGKPDPAGLLLLADRLGASSIVFVGDTTDDIKTAVDADDADPDRTYSGIGVLTGGLSGPKGRRRFEQAGAAMVLESVNDLPAALESFPGA